MKLTRPGKEEVEITEIEASPHIRYWEDAEINGESSEDGSLVPFKSGDLWKITIDVATGKIIDWPEGAIAEIHFKVCDGFYCILSCNKKKLFKYSGYVPAFMCPEEEGWGDYIIMDIDAKGLIKGWDPKPSLEKLLTNKDTIAITD